MFFLYTAIAHVQRHTSWRLKDQSVLSQVSWPISSFSVMQHFSTQRPHTFTSNPLCVCGDNRNALALAGTGQEGPRCTELTWSAAVMLHRLKARRTRVCNIKPSRSSAQTPQPCQWVAVCIHACVRNTLLSNYRALADTSCSSQSSWHSKNH